MCSELAPVDEANDDLAEHKAGWDISLERTEAFRDVILNCLDMDEEMPEASSKRAPTLLLRLARKARLRMRTRPPNW